ncbi:MAG: rhomboid family intramembrane serine protease [Planctomycetales bacterium]|nr:rhomboid family intramembrane serine protease [Planctomycetales bacterium]
MRSLGTIKGRKHAETFVAHLLTIGISTQIEELANQPQYWELWVRDEDRLDEAKLEFDSFLASPFDAKYEGSLGRAQEILEEKRRIREKAAANLRRVHPTQKLSLAQGKIPPLTLTLLVLSIGIFLFSSFPASRLGRQIIGQLSFVTEQDYKDGQDDPSASLRKGEVWRTITPIFLHGNAIHLAVNMLVLVSFGSMVERLLGTPRYALFVGVLALAPNLLQGLLPAALFGSPFFGGMSGVTYGLVSYLWVRTSVDPTLGVVVPAPFIILMVGLIVLGFLGMMPGIAHLCHLGGFLVGMIMGQASNR